MINDESLVCLGEDGAIALIGQVLGDQSLSPGWIGIGDDAAVTTLPPGEKALTTTDLLIEGTHFRRSTISAQDLGWKAIAVNASDIAGMAGTPRWATVSLALPSDVSARWIADFYRGAGAMGREIGLAIVGGDTVASGRDLMVAVTVVGSAARPALRTGAQAGDRLVVTGSLGDSAAGLWVLEEGIDLADARTQAAVEAHRRPVPHLAEAQAIARSNDRLAMMDNSDGLARSVAWLAASNGLEIEIEADSLPMSEATRAVAALGSREPQEWALYGGEDYGLVALVPPEAAERLATESRSWAHPLTVVGTSRIGSGVAIRTAEGVRPLALDRVYQHFSGECL
jgi:thiamine-monophosphate kinase